MLYDNDYDHVVELQDIMTSCDATILEDLPPELSKLTGHLVKKWWIEHGLPSAASQLRKDPEVNSSSTSVVFSCYYASNLCLLGFSIQSDGNEGDEDGEHDDQPKGAGRGEGSSPPYDGEDIAANIAVGHEDVAGANKNLEGDQNREGN
jgi:hypothetical protein